jgi:hypothetical protein
MAKVITCPDTGTQRNIHSQREDVFDDSTDQYDFESEYPGL